jgi:hypothetical protein
MTWTGVVYEVGTAGVNMRANPAVADGNARDVAARGARLALQCGQTGAVVTREDGTRTATWLRTTDGLWVSMLYVHVPDRASIPSCPGSPSDGPLLALSDPTASEQPPPPGAGLSPETTSASSPASQHRQTSSEDSEESSEVQAATPAHDATVGPSGVADSHPSITPTTTPGDSSSSGAVDDSTTVTLANGVVVHSQYEHRAKNPDKTPVG